MSDTTGSDRGSNAGTPTKKWLRLMEAIEAETLSPATAEDLAMEIPLTNWENAALAAQVTIGIKSSAVRERIREYTEFKSFECWHDMLLATHISLDLDFQLLKSLARFWTENHSIETEEDLRAAEELYSTSGFEHILESIEEYHRKQARHNPQDASLPEIPNIADSMAAGDFPEQQINAGDVSPFGDDNWIEGTIPRSPLDPSLKERKKFPNAPPLFNMLVTRSTRNHDAHIPQHARLDPVEIYAALKKIFDNDLPGTGTLEQAEQLQEAIDQLPPEEASDFFAYLNAIKTRPAIESASQPAVLLAIANHQSNRANIAVNQAIRNTLI